MIMAPSQKLDFRYQWLTVHIALATLRQLTECSPYKIEAHIQELKTAFSDLTKISKLPSYTDAVMQGIKEFETNWQTTITPQERQFVNSPQRSELTHIIKQRRSEIEA